MTKNEITKSEEKDREILRNLEDIVYESISDSDIIYYIKKVGEYEKKYNKKYLG